MLLISIPEPCHENWNEMLPCEKGAFCSACSKVVIDFTNLSDEEVKNYFFQNKGQKTCGRFKNHQLLFPEKALNQLLVDSIPFWKKFLAIVVILFGSFLTGCEQPTQGKVDTPEKIVTTMGLTLTDIRENRTMGEPQVEELATTCTTTKGFIEPVIIPDTITIDQETVGIMVMDERLFDTAMLTKPEVQRKDSVRKIDSDKNSCDSLEVNKRVFLDP
jgi:hypothetical protein